ncbi:MAG: helix-turn-helix transcriptional regulator [Clostridia bacterium]|nr:helix-turn-helix transcriptional regulator [Clostridia bacterium]
MNVGKRIRELREKQGYSQNELANIADVSQTHLRRIELGQSGVSVDHLQMICDALGISLVDFFDIENRQDELLDAAKKLTPKQKHHLVKFLDSL